jgi:TFIIIC subunit triple barrel domain
LPEQKEKSQSSTVPDIFQLYVPPGGKTPKKKRGQSTTGRKPYKRRKRNPLTGELEEIERPAQQNTPDEEQQQQNDIETGGALSPTRDVQAQIDNLGPEEYDVTIPQDEKDDMDIQILDLHTQNPLISFRGKVYSCEWSTSLGTDMFFMKRPETALEEDYKPVYSLDKWDLLGLSATRLLATEAKLTHRSLPQSQSRPADLESEEEPRQAGFLRRFVRLQVKKGEVSGDFDPVSATLTTIESATTATQPQALKAMFAGPISTGRDIRVLRGLREPDRSRTTAQETAHDNRRVLVAKASVGARQESENREVQRALMDKET